MADILITSTITDGVLYIASASAGQIVGTQGDSGTVTITAQAPDGYTYTQAEALINSDGKLYDYILPGAAFILPDEALAGKTVYAQIRYTDTDGNVVESANLLVFYLRGALDSIPKIQGNHIATQKNRVPLIYETDQGVLVYRSELNGYDKVVSGGSGGGGTQNHAELINLGYAQSGHTGFATATQGQKADTALQADHNASPTAHQDIRNAATALGTRMTQAETDIQTNETNIGANAAAIQNNATNISTAEGNITALGTRMGAAETNITTNANNISENRELIQALEGQGGFVPPYNFGVATPTQADLIAQLKIGIWGDDADSHADSEIFNGTRIQNTFDFALWVMVNTPSTDPPVFEVIRSFEAPSGGAVSMATNSSAGIARGSLDADKSSVNPQGELVYNSHGEVVALGTRMTAAEGNITDNAENIEQINSALVNQDANIAGIIGNVANLGTRMTAAEADISDNADNISANTTAIQGQATDITGLDSRVTALEDAPPSSGFKVPDFASRTTMFTNESASTPYIPSSLVANNFTYGQPFVIPSDGFYMASMQVSQNRIPTSQRLLFALEVDGIRVSVMAAITDGTASRSSWWGEKYLKKGAVVRIVFFTTTAVSLPAAVGGEATYFWRFDAIDA